jgi:DNA-damage-inducible protein D
MDDSAQNKSLAVFQDKRIRRIWQKDEWWFSVVDVIGALTESVDAKDYWYKLKVRETESSGVELSTFCRQLKLTAEDGKMRETDCSNTEGLFRIIQSIPSPKAEPFRLWLAKIGYQRVQEIHDPELAQARMKALYRAKGYSDEWIEKRVRGIAVRQELTEEWQKRGVETNEEFAILTDEISKATFGKTIQEYKEFKGLDKQNLRDHMNDLELIFTMLGEASTKEIEIVKNPQNIEEHKEASQEGGEVAKIARVDLEKKTKKRVISKHNYTELSEKEARKQIEK